MVYCYYLVILLQQKVALHKAAAGFEICQYFADLTIMLYGWLYGDRCCMFDVVCLVLYVWCCMLGAVCLVLYAWCCMFGFVFGFVCLVLYIWCCTFCIACLMLYVWYCIVCVVHLLSYV